MTAAGGAIVIDTESPAGSWRAAIDPNASCAKCCQSVCGCPDLEYAGLVPSLDGSRRRLAGGSEPAVFPFHCNLNSREGQYDHG